MAVEVAVLSAPSDDTVLQIFAVHEGSKVRTVGARGAPPQASYCFLPEPLMSN